MRTFLIRVIFFSLFFQIAFQDAFQIAFASNCEMCTEQRVELVALDKQAQNIESLTTKNKRMLEEMKEAGNFGAVTKLNSNLFILAIKRETIQNKKEAIKAKETELCSSC